MADNYLEKRMEEYRAGRLSRAYRPKQSASLQKSRLPQLRVFVTGGASGIGREIVRAFRRENCRVSFCDIDRKRGTETAQSTGAKYYYADVADAGSLTDCLDAVFTDRGDLDVIVNNAGVFTTLPLAETSIEEFDRVMAVNLRPVFITARRLAIHRRDLADPNPYGGRIINIASTRASMSEASTEPYSASKGGIVALTHALMMSLAEWGITVNAISPGWIETDPDAIHTDADRLQHPSRRVGTPADIARLALFLAEPANDFINGQNLTVDGGMTRKMIYV